VHRDTGGLHPPPSPLAAGLRCCCPGCGQGRLFQGYLTLARGCPLCGLDYAGLDTGDGPAVFIIFILGAAVVLAAVLVELAFTPPYWVHAMLWPPLIVGGALLLLRPAKALMVALHYRHAAGEGRRAPP
jgi:uncharacterized protein (DUF983 family)